MTLRELRRALRLLPAPYLDMPVYWSHHGEGLLVQVVAADPGGMGADDHPAVHLCHGWQPPESLMTPEVIIHDRRSAQLRDAESRERRTLCPTCKGSCYTPHGTPGWPDAFCDTCHGKGSVDPDVPADT